MRLLITGGTGYLGKYILDELENLEYREKLAIDTIRLMVRDPTKAEKIKSELYTLEIFEGDITNEESVKKATENVDAVLHLASKYSIKGKKKDFMKINVEGIKHLINGLNTGSTLILTSSVGIYGYSANKGKSFTENYEPKKPFWHYQITKKMQEDTAREMCKEKGIIFVALRSSLIAGPGDEPTKIILDNIKKGMMFLTRGGKGFVPIAHPKDVAKVHLLALEKAKGNDGETFHFASFHTTFKDYVNAFARELGSKPIKRRAPYWMLYTFGAIMEFLPIQSNFTRFSIKLLGASDILDMTKIKDRLGWTPQHTINEVVQETVAWYNNLKK